MTDTGGGVHGVGAGETFVDEIVRQAETRSLNACGETTAFVWWNCWRRSAVVMSAMPKLPPQLRKKFVRLDARLF